MIWRVTSAMDADMASLKTETHRLDIMAEAQETKLNQVLEIVQDIAERLGYRDPIERRLDKHEHRIAALESIYRRRE